jgi:pyruvate carboxylase
VSDGLTWADNSQYTNLQFQASQLGLGTQWLEIKKKYIEANQLVSYDVGCANFSVAIS